MEELIAICAEAASLSAESAQEKIIHEQCCPWFSVDIEQLARTLAPEVQDRSAIEAALVSANAGDAFYAAFYAAAEAWENAQ